MKFVKRKKKVAMLCPYHDEKTPSCLIDPDTGEFSCMGCGAKGQSESARTAARIMLSGNTVTIVRATEPGLVNKRRMEV